MKKCENLTLKVNFAFLTKWKKFRNQTESNTKRNRHRNDIYFGWMKFGNSSEAALFFAGYLVIILKTLAMFLPQQSMESLFCSKDPILDISFIFL